MELTKTARELSEVMLQDELDDEWTSLTPALERAIEEVRLTFPGAAIEVRGSFPQAEVVGNEMLDSVFRNLLQNAVQHNDKNLPQVAVTTSIGDDWVEVRVADNGPGVPDEQKEEIFGRGERGLDSEGTGIGLYLVESLVDGYGGGVWVEDRDPEGSVFVVRLPTVDPAER